MVVTVVDGRLPSSIDEYEADKSLWFIFYISYNWNQLLWKLYFDV